LIYSRKRKGKLNLHHDLLLEENKVRDRQGLPKRIDKLYRFRRGLKPQPFPDSPLERQTLPLGGSPTASRGPGIVYPAGGTKALNLSQGLTGKTGNWRG